MQNISFLGTGGGSFRRLCYFGIDTGFAIFPVFLRSLSPFGGGLFLSPVAFIAALMRLGTGRIVYKVGRLYISCTGGVKSLYR